MDRPPGQRDSKICLVVPCFNEAARLDVPAFEGFLSATKDVHFVFVNDGSNDETLSVLNGLAAKHPAHVQVFDQQPNAGKAEAVRQGMSLAMTGDGFAYAGYWDADLATPLDAVDMFVRVLERVPGVEIVFGTRVALLGRRIERLASRHYFGRIFATAASLVLDLPIYDTQCGAKLFRVNDRCRALFGTPFGSRWIFDVELVARYLQLVRAPAERGKDAAFAANIGIYEQPLDRWADIGDSKVRSIDFVRAIGEMAAIYRTYRLPKGRQGWLAFFTAPFLRYAGAGAVGTLAHYGVLMASVELANVPPGVGSAVGATVGALINYVINYNLTFASKDPHRKTLPRFLIVAAVGVALSGAVVKFAVERGGLHYLIAQLLATVLVLGTGFVLNKAWTFSSSK